MKKVLVIGDGRKCSAQLLFALVEVHNFIKENNYTYEVKDLVDGLKKRKEGYYNSYTMNHCLDNLTSHIEVLKNTI